MIGKRMTVGLLAALLVVSAVGAGGFPASVLAAGSSDDNDSRATATAIDVGQTETGTIEQGDVDWHAVEVESGKSIFANLTLTTENEEDLEFELYNPDGERIGEGPADLMVPGYHTMRMVTGGTAMGGDVAEQSGTYYVRIQPAGNNFNESTDYELTVETTELDENDPNEQPNTATQIEADETIAGVLSGSDRDTYAIDLEKGETITVSAEYDGSFTPSTSLVGPNASDVELDPYYDTEYSLAHEPIGRDHELTYTAMTTGTHFLRVNPNIESSTIVTFDEKASYEMSVNVSGQSSDQPTDDEDSDNSESGDDNEETNETPNETDADTDTDDSNEESDNTSNESDQSDDTEDNTSGESEQSDDTSNQSDDAEDDTSSDSSDC
ncbi:hypothetical protein [Halocatena marina]|uniref:hypothetical protein n=1 Tax=Halocatena marina TaxID=2934937 RepID=UPI00200D82B5|nr:hypothetical protein [Halocatena marina]